MDEGWETGFKLHVQGYTAIKCPSTDSNLVLPDLNKRLCLLTIMLYYPFHIKIGAVFFFLRIVCFKI